MTRLVSTSPRDIRDSEIEQSLLCHPLVGLIVGIIVLLPQYVLQVIEPALVAAALLLLWFWLSSSVHISGYLRTVRNWFEASRRPSSSFGGSGQDAKLSWIPTTAIVLLMLIKYSALVQASATQNFGAILIACVLARTVPVGLFGFVSYDSQSKFAGLTKINTSTRTSYIFIAIACVFTLLLAQLWAVAILLVCAVAAYLVYFKSAQSNKKISGDNCSAIIESFEALVLWVAVI